MAMRRCRQHRQPADSRHVTSRAADLYMKTQRISIKREVQALADAGKRMTSKIRKAWMKRFGWERWQETTKQEKEVFVKLALLASERAQCRGRESEGNPEDDESKGNASEGNAEDVRCELRGPFCGAAGQPTGSACAGQLPKWPGQLVGWVGPSLASWPTASHSSRPARRLCRGR